MSAFFYFLALLLLLTEGWLLAGLLLPVRDRGLRISLSLPLAALINVLLYFVLTLATLPITFWAVTVAHLLLIGALILIGRAWPSAIMDSAVPPSSPHRILAAVCLFILGSSLLYAFAHSFLLPTFQYDSMTNWIMRSKMSFLEHHIVFDNTYPHDAIRKPQYPILLHSLHLMGNNGQIVWNDQLATGTVFLVSLSLLLSLYFLIRRMAGTIAALVGVTVLVGIPLFGLHLGEGYADHLLAEFAVVSFAAFALALRDQSARWLMLSVCLCAAAVWTKAEGLFFVCIPWLVLLGLMLRPLRVFSLRQIRLPLIVLLVLILPWFLFVMVHGFSFTPHGGTDWSLGLQPGAILATLSVLFLGGSFSVFWALLFASILLLFTVVHRNNTLISARLLIFFVPAALCFLMVIAIYLLTPNADYLLNGESFDRQLLTPAALALLPTLLGLAPLLQTRTAHRHSA